MVEQRKIVVIDNAGVEHVFHEDHDGDVEHQIIFDPQTPSDERIPHAVQIKPIHGMGLKLIGHGKPR